MPYDKKKTKDTSRPAPKRKLSNITFENEGAHLALVSKDQGGPANGHDQALIIKATNGFSEEFIQKVQQVKVTMELPEFLRKFFNLYYDDAMVLAHLMGYVMPESEEEYEDPYHEYIEQKVQSIEFMKSLHESEDMTSFISKMKEDDYLAVLKDQEFLEEVISKSQKSSTEVKPEVGADTEEKAKAEVEKAKVKSGDFVSWNSSGGKAYGKVTSVKTSGSIKVNENVSINADSDNPAALITLYKKNSEGGWEPTDTKVAHKVSSLTKISALKKATLNNKTEVDQEEKMTDQVTDTTVAEFEVEVVEKSALEAIEKAAKEDKEKLEKALAEQKESLQKALDMIAAFEQEKKEAITKARFDALKDAVKDEAKAEVLFKAVSLVEDQAEFDAVVKALKDMTELAEKGELFVEKGVSVEGEGTESKKESAVAKLLKAQATKNK